MFMWDMYIPEIHIPGDTVARSDLKDPTKSTGTVGRVLRGLFVVGPFLHNVLSCTCFIMYIVPIDVPLACDLIQCAFILHSLT